MLQLPVSRLLVTLTGQQSLGDVGEVVYDMTTGVGHELTFVLLCCEKVSSLAGCYVMWNFISQIRHAIDSQIVVLPCGHERQTHTRNKCLL